MWGSWRAIARLKGLQCEALRERGADCYAISSIKFFKPMTNKNKKGSIKMETVALGLLILSGYLGDMFFSRYGENWGYAGIVIGPALFLFVVHGIAWLERQLFIGQEPLPKCKCGNKAINELKDSSDAEPYIAGKGKKVCSCGTYLIGRGIIKYQHKDSEPVDYAIWKKGRWELKIES